MLLLSSPDFFFFSFSNHSETLPENSTVWSQISIDILSALILVQTVYKDHQQMTKLWRACADPESFVRGGPNLITFY